MSHSFTPGPWEADGNVIRSKFGGQICMFSPWIRQTADQLEDNARLIAAAPDLIEALQAIMPFTATMAIGCHGEKCREPWCHSCNSEEEAEEAAQKGCDAFAKARAAIAKATGEHP